MPSTDNDTIFRGKASTGGAPVRTFWGDPLSARQVNHILKQGIKAIGLPPHLFPAHSFRIGAASSASMCGVPEEQIKSMGRWKSGAFESYIRPDLVFSIV